MKITVTQEKTWQYFAKILGDIWVHAVGSTPDEAISFLMDIYKDINELRQQRIYSKLFGWLKTKQNLFAPTMSFRSFTISL